VLAVARASPSSPPSSPQPSFDPGDLLVIRQDVASIKELLFYGATTSSTSSRGGPYLRAEAPVFVPNFGSGGYQDVHVDAPLLGRTAADLLWSQELDGNFGDPPAAWSAGVEKQVAAFSGGLPDDIPDSVPVFDMARFDDTEGLCDASAGIGPFGQSTEGQLFSALPGSGRSFHPGLSSSSCAAEETKAEADDAGVRDYFARLMDSLNNSVFVSQLQTVLQATQPWQPPGLFVFGRSGREAAAKLGASEAGPRRIRKRAAGSSRPGTDLEIHITGIRDRLLNLPRNDRRAFLEALPLEDQRALEQHLWSRAADRGLFATAGRMHQPPNQGTRHVRFREPEAEAYFEQTPPDDNFDFFDGSFGADWDGAPLSGI